MITIQLVGLIMGLSALYLTYIYYKRASFTKKEFILWIFIWLVFISVTIFPTSVTPIVGYLGLQRPMDLIMIVAFIILFAFAFHNYVVTRRLGKKVETIIRELAIKDLDKK